MEPSEPLAGGTQRPGWSPRADRREPAVRSARVVGFAKPRRGDVVIGAICWSRNSGHESERRAAGAFKRARGTRQARLTTRWSGARVAQRLDVTRGRGSGLPARRPDGARRSGLAVPQGGGRIPVGRQVRLPRHRCRHAQPLGLGPPGEERSKLAQEGVASPLVCRGPGSPVDRWRASVEWRDQAAYGLLETSSTASRACSRPVSSTRRSAGIRPLGPSTLRAVSARVRTFVSR